MSARQFSISSDIYCNSLHTNNLNAVNIEVDTLIPNNIDLPIGGEYRIGGVHVLSTPVQASSVALGNTAPTGQGTGTVAIGLNAGQTSQGENSVAVGLLSGQTNQGQFCVAIGGVAGETSQGQGSTAVGFEAGNASQGVNSVAVGNAAGGTNLGNDTVAVGFHACLNGDGGTNVCVGTNSCANFVIGTNNTAVGDSTSIGTGFNNCIVIGAGATATGSGQLVVASAAHPIPTVGTAGAITQYLPVTLNGVNYKLALYAP